MSTRIDQVSEEWEPVPPGHPDRPAFEEKMHSLGIRPATRWEPRTDRRVFQRPGWRAWLRRHLGF